MNEDGRIDRRGFARQLAAGTGCLTAGLAGTSAVGAEVPPAPDLPETPAAKPGENPARPDDATPETPPPEVLLLTYLVRSHPSDHLDEQAIQGIFRDIRGDLARGQLLAEFPLKNSDEPAFAFRAFRGTEGRPADEAF